MKTTAYIAPQTKVCRIQGEELLNTISAPERTNTTDLGVSDEEYTGEAHVKGSGYNVWNDAWSE